MPVNFRIDLEFQAKLDWMSKFIREVRRSTARKRLEA